MKIADLTIKELNILFLGNIYNKVSVITYANYQHNAKIVNEFFQDIKIDSITTKHKKAFTEYLKHNRVWETVDCSSIQMVNEIYNYFEKILNWKDKNVEKLLAENNLNIEELYNTIIESEHKRILDKLGKLLEI